MNSNEVLDCVLLLFDYSCGFTLYKFYFKRVFFCFILNFDLIPILLEKSTLSPSTTSKPKEVTEKPQCNCQCPNNIENVLPGVHTTKKPDPPPQVEG